MSARKAALGDSRELPMPSLDPGGLQRALGETGYRRHGVPRADDVLVRLKPQALEEMRASVAGAQPLVQAGVLLGEVQQAGASYLVTVERALEFAETRPEATRVRVPRRAWQQVLRRRQTEFRHLRVVGWYHGHPGLGATFSEADRFVQRYFFPAEWQVACVLDPQRDEVQFYQRRGRDVTPTGGFYTSAEGAARPHLAAVPARAERGADGSVDGPAVPASPAPGRSSAPARNSAPSGQEGERAVLDRDEAASTRPQSDSYLRERFVERSLEKIQKLLKDPPMHPRDYVMMGMMLVLALLVVLYRPAAPDSAQLAEISRKLDAVTQRLDNLQTGPARTAHAAVDRGPSAPASGEPDALHPVSEGETLWSICNAYYHDGGLMHGLMVYNQIGSAQDLRPGDMVKIPSRERLQQFMKARKKAAQ